MNVDHFKLGKLLVKAKGANVRVDPVHTSVILTTSHHRDFGGLAAIDELFPFGARWFKMETTLGKNLPKALSDHQTGKHEVVLSLDDLMLLYLSL